MLTNDALLEPIEESENGWGWGGGSQIDVVDRRIAIVWPSCSPD